MVFWQGHTSNHQVYLRLCQWVTMFTLFFSPKDGFIGFKLLVLRLVVCLLLRVWVSGKRRGGFIEIWIKNCTRNEELRIRKWSCLWMGVFCDDLICGLVELEMKRCCCLWYNGLVVLREYQTRITVHRFHFLQVGSKVYWLVY